jgi:hypothetical protein
MSTRSINYSILYSTFWMELRGLAMDSVRRMADAVRCQVSQ